MKKVPFVTLISINIFFLLQIPAFSSDWKHIGTFGDGDYYIDHDSIKYDGSKVTFWWKVENGENKNVKTTVDCNSKIWTIRDAVVYKPDGSLGAVVHVTEKNLEWVGITLDSAADKWHKLLCKDK